MTLKNDRYSYRVTWSNNDREYVGLCAEFPSLSWLAGTPEAALKGIRSVVAEGIKIMWIKGKGHRCQACTFHTSQHSRKFCKFWNKSLSDLNF